VNIVYGYIGVFFGAGIGALLRHAVNRTGMRLGLALPWSTFCVNVSGCLAMGSIAGWFAFRGQASQPCGCF
jgi:fluoride exporter